MYFGFADEEQATALLNLFHSLQHPEVIVLGRDVPMMHRMINGIGEQIKSGEPFGHLDEAGDILDRYNVQFRSVEQKHYGEYLGYARWFYQGDDFSVYPSCRTKPPFRT